MTYDYELGDGAHAIDQQLELDYHRGYQVVNAAGGSNLVDDNNTADLTIRANSGDINAGGTTVSCAEQTLDLSGVVDANNPRKVTVYRDTNGDAQFAAGTPEAAQPSGEVRRQAYRPAPPTLAGTKAVVLATVWLPAGAASVSDADIRDRRLPAELNVESLGRNLDAQGNDISNVGALSTGTAAITDVAAYAYPTASVPFAADTDTRVPLDATRFEDAPVLSVDTTNDNIEVNEAGKYLIIATVDVFDDNDGATAGDTVVTRLRKNGNITSATKQSMPDNLDAIVNTVSLIDAKADDTITVTVENEDNPSTLFGDTTGQFTLVSVARIG